MKDVEINHHENGDSDFTFQVTMNVGATDGADSIVTLGGLRFVIHRIYSEELKEYVFILQEGHYDTRIYGSLEFDSKADAIKWLIHYITKV